MKSRSTFPISIIIFIFVLFIILIGIVFLFIYFIKNPIKSNAAPIINSQIVNTISGSNTGKENTVFTDYSVLPFNEIYNNKEAGFSVNYPSSKDWVWRVDIHDTDIGSHAIIFINEDSNLLQGSTKFTRLAITSDKENNPNWKTSIESTVNLILSGYKNKSLVMRNVTALLPSLPEGTISEVFEVEGSITMQGGLLKKEKGLFMIASNGIRQYRFDFRADPQDFDSLYPLIVKILKTFSIYQ